MTINNTRVIIAKEWIPCFVVIIPTLFEKKVGILWWSPPSVRPSVLATISSYTKSTRTLKFTHMVAMSICATLHYLEFWSDPWVKSYRGWGGAASEIITHFFRLFYIYFFISTPIHFKLILDLTYDNTVNLNHAWPHSQPWGAPPT